MIGWALVASQRTMRAAVRVSTAESTGSGFIVSRSARLILTARHCIETRASRLLEEVDVHFSDPASENSDPVICSSPARRVAHGEGDADWALLQATRLPDWTTTELRLLDLQVAAESRWSTYGFPADRGDGEARGQDFGGMIRMGGKTLIRILDETSVDEAITGLSGGPVVVEEEVIGLITRADANRQGRAITGRLYALPLAACKELARHVTIHEEPAFLEKTADAFARGDGSGLRSAIQTIFRADHHMPLDCISRPALHLALCLLLRRRVDIVPKVFAETGLRGEHARDVLTYAASQWYPRTSAITAARHLAPQGDGPSRTGARSRAVSVGCPNNNCAELFVRRAGFDLTRSTTWHEGRLDAAWLPYLNHEPEETLAEQVRRALAHKLALDPDASPEAVAQELRTHMEIEDTVRYPVFFWIPLPEDASDTELEALRRQYPDLRIVALGRPRPAELALPIELDPHEARKRVAELDAIVLRYGERFNLNPRGQPP